MLTMKLVTVLCVIFCQLIFVRCEGESLDIPTDVESPLVIDPEVRVYLIGKKIVYLENNRRNF